MKLNRKSFVQRAIAAGLAVGVAMSRSPLARASSITLASRASAASNGGYCHVLEAHPTNVSKLFAWGDTWGGGETTNAGITFPPALSGYNQGASTNIEMARGAAYASVATGAPNPNGIYLGLGRNGAGSDGGLAFVLAGAFAYVDQTVSFAQTGAGSDRPRGAGRRVVSYWDGTTEWVFACHNGGITRWKAQSGGVDTTTRTTWSAATLGLSSIPAWKTMLIDSDGSLYAFPFNGSGAVAVRVASPTSSSPTFSLPTLAGSPTAIHDAMVYQGVTYLCGPSYVESFGTGGIASGTAASIIPSGTGYSTLNYSALAGQNPSKNTNISLGTCSPNGSTTVPGRVFTSANQGTSWTEVSSIDAIATTLYAGTGTGPAYWLSGLGSGPGQAPFYVQALRYAQNGHLYIGGHQGVWVRPSGSSLTAGTWYPAGGLQGNTDSPNGVTQPSSGVVYAGSADFNGIKLSSDGTVAGNVAPVGSLVVTNSGSVVINGTTYYFEAVAATASALAKLYFGTNPTFASNPDISDAYWRQSVVKPNGVVVDAAGNSGSGVVYAIPADTVGGVVCGVLSGT